MKKKFDELKKVEEVVTDAENEIKEKIIIKKVILGQLRQRETPMGKVLGILDEGMEVRVVEEKDGWSKLDNGCYVMTEFLK